MANAPHGLPARPSRRRPLGRPSRQPPKPTLLVLPLFLQLLVLVLGAALWASPLAAGSCLTAVDCAMNGECRLPDPDDPQQAGACACMAGWTGEHCEVLDLQPTSAAASGLQLPDNSSSWGGSIIHWPADNKYHMFASRITNHCGLYDWDPNSEVVRAEATNPGGPYTLAEVVLPPFAHDANAILAPTGEIVLFVTALAGAKTINCSESDVRQKTSNRTVPVPPKDTYMLWARQPQGPWSTPVMVLNSTKWNSDYWNKTGRVAKCDANLNGIIQPDGSFIGLWRRCETDALLTIPHTLYASDWRNASTYTPDISPLFVLGGSGAEDPSNIWTTTSADGTRAFHALFHDEQATRCMLPTGCSANGRHAFSLDGKAWRYASEDAWTRNVTFSDAPLLRADTRARPHVLVDANGSPTHLSNGLKPSSVSGHVWTLVVPLGRGKH